jgi:hypothetical protein
LAQTLRPIKPGARDRALRIAASGLSKLRYGVPLSQAVRETLIHWSLDPETADPAFIPDALAVAIAEQLALVADTELRLVRERELLDLLEAAAAEEKSSEAAE